MKETEDAKYLIKNTMSEREKVEKRGSGEEKEEKEELEEETLENYFGKMKDEEFTRAIDKITTKNKKEAKEIQRLKKEASRHLGLSEAD